MTAYSVAWLRDYVERYSALLLMQWRKPRRLAIFQAILAEVQALEDALYAVLTGVNLDTAVGAQLDLIGKILKTPRLGLDDESYRLRLRVEILVLSSNGHPDDLLAILLAALPTGFTFSYAETDYATSLPQVHGALSSATATLLVSFLKRAKSVGTRVMLEYSEADDEHTFTFADDIELEVDSGRGFSDSGGGSTGGVFEGVAS